METARSCRSNLSWRSALLLYHWLLRVVVLAVEERNHQKAFVVRQTDVARIGERRAHVAVRGAVVVDQHVGQQLGLRVLMADADAHVFEPVEEEAVAEFERLLLFADVVEGAGQFLVGGRHEVVGDEEAPHGDDAYQNDERPDDLGQRHARRLHGQQFVVLAEVAHGHDGRQQHRERQSHGDHVGHGVAEQFDDDPRAEALAHQLVDVTPQEIHHQHEHDDEERQDHGPEVRFQDEFMDGFHRRAGCFSLRKDSSFTIISAKVRVNIMAAPGGTSK